MKKAMKEKLRQTNIEIIDLTVGNWGCHLSYYVGDVSLLFLLLISICKQLNSNTDIWQVKEGGTFRNPVWPCLDNILFLHYGLKRNQKSPW